MNKRVKDVENRLQTADIPLTPFTFSGTIRVGSGISL